MKADSCWHCHHSAHYHSAGAIDPESGMHVKCCALCIALAEDYPATKADCPGFALTKGEATRLGHFKSTHPKDRKKPNQTFRKQTRIA